MIKLWLQNWTVTNYTLIISAKRRVQIFDKVEFCFIKLTNLS